MSKTRLTANLTKSSFQKLVKQVEQYKNNLTKGVELGVKELTEKLYDLVIKNCVENGFTIHHNNIYWDYDVSTNTGRVYTDDIVVIFNEFGTGIKGTQDEWADNLGYKVNASGKGEEGWKFYNSEHGYGGITHGVESKHMFYNALKEIEPLIGETINYSIARLTGSMY